MGSAVRTPGPGEDCDAPAAADTDEGYPGPLEQNLLVLSSDEWTGGLERLRRALSPSVVSIRIFTPPAGPGRLPSSLSPTHRSGKRYRKAVADFQAASPPAGDESAHARGRTIDTRSTQSGTSGGGSPRSARSESTRVESSHQIDPCRR